MMRGWCVPKPCKPRPCVHSHARAARNPLVCNPDRPKCAHQEPEVVLGLLGPALLPVGRPALAHAGRLREALQCARQAVAAAPRGLGQRVDARHIVCCLQAASVPSVRASVFRCCSTHVQAWSPARHVTIVCAEPERRVGFVCAHVLQRSHTALLEVWGRVREAVLVPLSCKCFSLRVAAAPRSIRLTGA